MSDSLGTFDQFQSGGKSYRFCNLTRLEDRFDVATLPYCLKLLLENLLRLEDGRDITESDIRALCNWDPAAEPATEIAFTPARVVLQDFTGVPAVVDLAAMREAMRDLGGEPDQINPLSPAELVIDHSVQVDVFGKAGAVDLNAKIEFSRNQERYEFLKWGQSAFDNFKVVPPSTGIVHQVNLEYLARVVFGGEKNGDLWAWPDTLVGTDSHTTMINGLGVLGWGVGGIEAEAAMLGQPITMLIPQVVGFELAGKLPEGATATDLVLTVTEMLRDHGVVGKFVEFFGDGLDHLPLADRATIANMSPEYGATCGIFPIDNEVIRYMKLSGRSDQQVQLVEDYARATGMWRGKGDRPARYSATLKLNLAEVQPSLAGPKRPQDRVTLDNMQHNYRTNVTKLAPPDRYARSRGEARYESEGGGTAVGNDEVEPVPAVDVEYEGSHFTLTDGAVVIAAITSCTNTSNPAVMLGAGLIARNAAAKGLDVKPWVKTSLAPGSQVVTDYLNRSGLMDDLEALGFYLVGYGCTTCIGNSGPLPEPIGKAVRDNELVVGSVLSGNRNFEGRIHSDIKMNYLASPPLVVAYALAGTLDIDLANDAIGTDQDGNDVFLKDIWPSTKEIADTVRDSVDAEMFSKNYAEVFTGSERWRSVKTSQSSLYDWNPESTYIKNPPYFEAMGAEADDPRDVVNARALALLGDSITTDHISPAGAIAKDSPAGEYLLERGVAVADFNSYGSRRGNHEVMMRGTFANVRLRNLLAPGTEGGWTTHIPSDEVMTIFDAAMRYADEGTPLVVLAGTEYGTGSSRDWAAKGTLLLGVKAVIAASYERIHRSNLIGMGVLPLQFKDGENAKTLGLTGKETFTISGLKNLPMEACKVIATAHDGAKTEFEALVRLDTPKEFDYYRHGGILHYVLRQLARGSSAAGAAA